MIPTESVFSKTVLPSRRSSDLVSGQRDSVAGRSHCLFALNEEHANYDERAADDRGD